jgi:hypothetical protein
MYVQYVYSSRTEPEEFHYCLFHFFNMLKISAISSGDRIQKYDSCYYKPAEYYGSCFTNIASVYRKKTDEKLVFLDYMYRSEIEKTTDVLYDSAI